MAVFNEPAQWDHTLGNNADASTLPDDAAATAGIASLQKLFQLINATPLEAGGIAPDREDVNALFKYLGDSIFYAMNGGVPSYNAAYDYIPGRVVSYNNNLYKCIQANGVSSTVVAPDSNTAYWQRLDNFVRSVNGVNPDADGNVKYDNVPDWNAGVTITSGYVCPSNGVVVANMSSPVGIGVDVNDIRVIIQDFHGVMGTGGVEAPNVSGNCPVAKNDVIKVYNWDNKGKIAMTFYPLKTVTE